MLGTSAKAPEPTSLETALAQALSAQPWQLADEIAHRAQTRRGEAHAWARLGDLRGGYDRSDEARALAFALANVGKPVKLPIPKPRPLVLAANVDVWQLELAPLIGVQPIAPKPVPRTNFDAEMKRLREQCTRRTLAPLTAEEERIFAEQSARIRETNARIRGRSPAAPSGQWELSPEDLADTEAAVAKMQERFAADRRRAGQRPPTQTDDSRARREEFIANKNTAALEQAAQDLELRIQAETRVGWLAIEAARRATYAAIIARADELVEQVYRDDKGSLRYLWMRELRLSLDDGASPIFMPRGAKRLDFALYAIAWLKERHVRLDGAAS